MIDLGGSVQLNHRGQRPAVCRSGHVIQQSQLNGPVESQTAAMVAGQRKTDNPSADVWHCVSGLLVDFWGPETAALHLLVIADCPSYTAVHYRWSGLPCCHCPHLEQSASTRHVRTLYVCFPKTLEGFPLQAFLSMTRYRNFCSACAVPFFIFRHFSRSFYLFTRYLLTYFVIT